MESLKLPPYHENALQGRSFRALNPTMGSGIAMGIQTTFSDTANVLASISVPAGTVMILDYLRLICTAAGASTTSSDLAIVTDAIDRYSSGGTQLTAKGAHQGNARIPSSLFFFGVVTAAAASAKRQLSRLRLKTQAAPCWTVGDEVVVKFGAPANSIGLLSGTVASRFEVETGPIICGHPSAASSVLFHMFNTANAVTPPSWEVEFGYWEL